MRGRFLITPHAAAVKRAAPGRYIESPMPCRVPLFHGGGSLIREARFDSAHACADFLGFFGSSGLCNQFICQSRAVRRFELLASTPYLPCVHMFSIKNEWRQGD